MKCSLHRMNNAGPVVRFRTGLLEYGTTLELQRKAVSLVENGIVDEFYFILEHYPVYTAGLHFSEAVYDNSLEVIRVERGGGITFHGPGQIVVYPIVSLSRRGITIKDLIGLIHESEIQTLSHYGLQAEGRLNKETGVWIGESKISSTGFYIKGSTTMHGIALNVNIDLNGFLKIDPCGFSPEVMTSMKKELQHSPDLTEVREILWENIMKKMKISQFLDIRGPDDINETRISELLSGTVP